jgi:hypothetical protein
MDVNRPQLGLSYVKAGAEWPAFVILGFLKT